jgi:SAM-dependent methyltransferase
MMDRNDWLKERRRLAEERMDTIFAPIYDQHWGAVIAPTHARMLSRFLELCPPGCTILDAACGTGKYWQMILASGRTVYGIDQSQGMLNRLQAKHPGMPVRKVGLQELDFHAQFPVAMCIDAMEYIFPEDWSLVLHNLHRALEPGGCLYLTVELAMENEVENAYITAQRLGFPVVYGEWAIEGGYHYYPEISQVKEWLSGAGFHLLAEALGDEYLHIIARREV